MNFDRITEIIVNNYEIVGEGGFRVLKLSSTIKLHFLQVEY